MLNSLLTTHPRLRRPLANTALTCALMGCSILAMQWVAAAGLARAGPVHWWSAASAAWVLACLVLICSGLTAHWHDPAFTLVQIGGALASNAAAYAIAGQARGIVPPMLALIMVFSVFGLKVRQIKGLLAYGLVIYAAAGAAAQWWAHDPPAPALAAAHLLIIAVVLVASAALAIRIDTLRQRLKQQKHELAEALARIQEIATRDELTGLPNRRHMHEAMRVAILNAQRQHQPLLLALLDLDHFKRINDSRGHAVGDQVLQAFAATVQDCVRAGDILARWGGEEFVLMAAHVPAGEGAALLERVRLAVASMAVAAAQEPAVQITVSLGAALLQPDDTWQTLLARADRALYAAKAQGRDQVAWAPPEPGT